MLQPKHTSHQISPRFTGRPPNRTSSPTTLAPTNSYAVSRSSERSPESMAPSTRPSTFTVPRSMESPIDQTVDFQAGNLSEFLPPNKPWWWSKDTCLAKESAGRYSHHRESSLTSTLGSTGPNSPCSPNISTPQIAAADSVDDSCDGHSSSPWNYHFTTSDPIPLQQDHYLYTGPQLLGLQMSNPNTKVPYTMNSYMGNQSYRPPKASDVQVQHQSQPRTPKGFATRQLGHYASDGDPENRRRGKQSRQRLPSSTPSGNSQELDCLVIPDVPKLDRTMTDVYNDGLYNPNLDIVASSAGNSERQPPPTNNVFSHLNTGTSTLASSSPGCHHGSDTPPNHSHFHPPQGAYNVGTLRQNAAPRSVSEVNSPQTISPQDSLLDFADGDCTKNFTLFPRAESSRFGGMNQLTDEEVSLGQCESSTPQYLVDDEAIGSAHYLSPGTSGVYALHNLSAFGAQQHLQPTITFEGRGNASNASRTSGGRPGENEDGGTYSCTYHGCMLRFDTPALLQKHKREGHRQAGGLKPTQRGMKGAVMDTQAGPHRCYRINPGTGKICRAVFSRPYDLTRHEDTIHNARKQKVRCDLCTEEKLFSRADALTRHYRVCHPDVELPGKHRRRRNMN